MSVAQAETAVILAAGWGSRVQGLATGDEPISKPMIELEGTPMVTRVIRTLAQAGIRRFVVVTGYLSERVEAEVDKLNGANGITITTIFNPRWNDLANGVSALAARPKVKGPFLLSMSDHVYDVAIARDLLAAGDNGMGVRLCIDRKIDQVFDLDDATKVVTENERIVRIGKMLESYNAIDIGLFYCNLELFDALQAAYDKRGDCSLSDGMQLLGHQDRFGFFDIGPYLWQDVDTPETLEFACKLLADDAIDFAK